MKREGRESAQHNTSSAHTRRHVNAHDSDEGNDAVSDHVAGTPPQRPMIILMSLGSSPKPRRDSLGFSDWRVFFSLLSAARAPIPPTSEAALSAAVVRLQNNLPPLPAFHFRLNLGSWREIRHNPGCVRVWKVRTRQEYRQSLQVSVRRWG